ncbi:hypothetical protein FSP39_012760 [Pinctada imbricata]|uniref:Uncharacterized protein n=1 Tax=Pinctada imbricata TaxID=66713 RepID=A0AA88YJR3_PINIB|nr:hypothetical protein FSP39_012760 [Pinctada imbricata]
MGLTWKDLILKHFGQKLRNKVEEFRLNILAVDVGLKPGYLFDFGVQNLHTISIFLKDLNLYNLIGNQLMAVKADMDYLIVNNLCLCEVYDNKGDHYRFVDVSPRLTAPREITLTELESCAWRDDLFNIIDSMKGCKNENVFEIPPMKLLNMTSLFGILLGYPIVYWYETDGVDSGNCLCMEQLHHYKVVGNTDQGFRHVIYSFSAPSCLSDMKDHVEKWFENMKNGKMWSSCLREIYFEINTVTLPVVTL